MSYFEDRYTHVYKPGQAVYRLKARELMRSIQKFDARAINSLLDLGCGCGDLAEAVHQGFNASVAGIDLDDNMVRIAREKKVGEFHAGNVLSPIESLRGRFDAVCSFEVFEHLTHEDHARMLSVYKTCAKPGGLGVIMVPNAGHPLLGSWLTWSDYTHRTGFTTESLAQMLRSYGVKKARITPWYLAGNSALLTFRQLWGTLLGKFAKACVASLSTAPGATDPFTIESWPLSSHLIAVFQIPSL